MNRVMLFASFVSLALLGSGCAQGSETSSPTEETLSADEALQTFVDGLQPLQSLGETDGNPATEFRKVTDTLNPLVAPLTEGIDGVPSDITTEAAVATGAMTVSMDLVVDCLSDSAFGDECDPLVANAVTQAQSLGEAMSELVPYSSWTIEELLSEMR